MKNLMWGIRFSRLVHETSRLMTQVLLEEENAESLTLRKKILGIFTLKDKNKKLLCKRVVPLIQQYIQIAPFPEEYMAWCLCSIALLKAPLNDNQWKQVVKERRQQLR